ncbi:hypothetical protein Tco_0051485 [Tanacetum coccineum]
MLYVVPPVLASQFELKIGLLNLVTAISFDGFQNDDPNSHIRRFTKITQTIKLNQDPARHFKLILFLLSLKEQPDWLEKETSKFLHKLGTNLVYISAVKRNLVLLIDADIRSDRYGLEVADGNADNESKEISQKDGKESRPSKYQDNRNKKTTKRTVPVEETTLNDLVSECDGLGYDWSDQDAEGPTNFTLMAYTSSGSLSSSSSDSESRINVGAYKAGLKSIEAKLDVYKKNEAVFEEDIKILKLDIMLRDNALIELRNKFEKAKKERDDLKLTLEKFESSSKNLSKLLEIQVSNKFKTGVGFDS